MSQLLLFESDAPLLPPTWQALGWGWATGLLVANNVLHFWGTPNGWWQTACGVTGHGGPFTDPMQHNPPPATACVTCAAKWRLAAGKELRHG